MASCEVSSRKFPQGQTSSIYIRTVPNVGERFVDREGRGVLFLKGPQLGGEDCHASRDRGTGVVIVPKGPASEQGLKGRRGVSIDIHLETITRFIVGLREKYVNIGKTALGKDR
jgi:hypothetical protein